MINNLTFYLHLNHLVKLLTRLTDLRSVKIEDNSSTYFGDLATSEIQFYVDPSGSRAARFVDTRTPYRHRSCHNNAPSNELAQLDKIMPVSTEYVFDLTHHIQDIVPFGRPGDTAYSPRGSIGPIGRKWATADFPSRTERPHSIVCDPAGRRSAEEHGLTNDRLIDEDLPAALNLIDDGPKSLRLIAMAGIPSTADFYHAVAQRLIDLEVCVVHLCLASCGVKTIYRKQTPSSPLSEILACGLLWEVNAGHITVDVSDLNGRETSRSVLHPSIRRVTFVIDGDLTLPGPRELAAVLLSSSHQPVYRLSYTGADVDRSALTLYNEDLRQAVSDGMHL